MPWHGPYTLVETRPDVTHQESYLAVLVSPEVWSHIGLPVEREDIEGASCLAWIAFSEPNSTWTTNWPRRMHRLVCSSKVVKNGVFTGKFQSMCGKLIWISEPKYTSQILSSIALSIVVMNGSIHGNYLEEIQQELKDVPVVMGDYMTLGNIGTVRVQGCSPAAHGIIASTTDITVSERSGNLFPSLTFCTGLMGLGRELETLKCSFDLHEIPLEVANHLVAEMTYSSPINVSCTVFINVVCSKQLDDDFCYLTSPNAKRDHSPSVVVQLVVTQDVPVGKAFATPSLLHYLRGQMEGLNRVQLQLPSKELAQTGQRKISESVLYAKTAQISVLSSPVYAQLSGTEISEILKSYFTEAKYVFEGIVLEIELNRIALNLKSLYRLSWAFAQKSIHVKVVRMECSERSVDLPYRIGAFISANKTTLFQKSLVLAFATGSGGASSNIILVSFFEAIYKNIQETNESIVLLLGAPGQLLIRCLPHLMGFNLQVVDCRTLQGDSIAATEARLKQAFARVCDMKPILLVFLNVGSIGVNSEGRVDHRILDRFRIELLSLEKANHRKESEVLVFGQENDKSRVHKQLASLFAEHIEIDDSLSEMSRRSCLEWMRWKYGISFNENCIGMEELARRTGGFGINDLEALIRKSSRVAQKRSGDPFASLDQADIEKALKDVHGVIADAIGAPKIPNVRWSDVGGLDVAKREILDTIEMPLRHPELLQSGLKRSGVLMYGPPGVGKTLLAKAVATELSLNFLSVKGPELLNMYVGQSERNVRDIFARARAASPSIIFFDELDALAPNRGKAGDSGGVMDRVVSQLLAELDGVCEGSQELVFVIGATNRPDLVDTALLRPGRFDRLVYLGIATNVRELSNIIASLTQKSKMAAACTPESVADLIMSYDKGPVTGADLYSICAEASLNAIRRRITALEESCDGDEDVFLEECDFNAAIAQFVPSVTATDLSYYESVRDNIENSRTAV